MATTSRLSYADLAKKSIPARSPNDVQKTSPTPNAPSSAPLSTALSVPTSGVNTPSSVSAQPISAPSPPPDQPSLNGDAKTIWDIRKEQFSSRRQSGVRPSPPASSSTTSIPDGEDLPAVKQQRQPPPPSIARTVASDTESWPTPATAAPIHQAPATANPAEISGSARKSEKTKWVTIPPAELQAAADAVRRSQSRHNSASRAPRTAGPSNAGSTSGSRATSRVQSRTGSPRLPRGRRLPDDIEPSSSSLSPPVEFSYTQRNTYAPPPIYNGGGSPSNGYLPPPGHFPPYHQHPAYNYTAQAPPPNPYLYWNGYAPTPPPGSESHTPEFGYPYAHPPLPYVPPPPQNPEQTSTENSAPLPALKPPPPEVSEPVTGPALERTQEKQADTSVTFGSIDGPAHPPTPPPEATSVADTEKALGQLSVDDQKDTSEPKWEFGSTKAASGKARPQPALFIPGQPFQPNGYYPPTSGLPASDASSPANRDDPDMTVRDFGYGFGNASGTGNAVNLAREEQGRRERQRELERENGDVQQEPALSSPSDSRPPFYGPPRGRRGGGFFNDRRPPRGRGGGYRGGRGMRGGFNRGGFSPTQQPYVPPFIGGDGRVPFGETTYYGVPPMFPPPFPVGAGYYGYDGAYRPAEMAMMPPPPALNGLPAASPTTPNQPPLPVPVTKLSFPLDNTRYLVLGQIEYYLSSQNLAQDLFLRRNMDSEGWITFALLASFNRVKQLTNGENAALVHEVMSLSSTVEINAAGDSVRTHEWRSFVLPTASSSQAVSPAAEVKPDSSPAVEEAHQQEQQHTEAEAEADTEADIEAEGDGEDAEEEEEEIEFVLGTDAGYVQRPVS
ncbi:hypothetical protein CYLTODRAFT_487754 [Cylindrobasidium torrendii FP15055 ss-10]|uniref:HTH La-type RNA-binding domain-containing protein n=1 Tax=Cylindrobasidium torrendii FP15055 ss-10 TaxID=1314674 RepID=A0A0D7BL54_9AGAR|nr:hypothetical protein CYLTODRAFT_487754 [Cylindrobasidium torrendii FP15055 ss-10]